MHIEYIPTRTSTGKLSHTAILLRQSYRENGKVKKKTIANLTHVSPKVLEGYKLLVKYQRDPSALVSAGEIQITQGKSIGASFTASAIAKKLHITDCLGTTKMGKLALFQIISRVIAQGSRLSSIRLSGIHNMTDILGIDFSFNEDHLYKNLAWLADEQKQIEKQLFKKGDNKRSDLFLYDVTSSYFEGESNELAAYGYNRDRKKGKKQVVLGLLCAKDGEPVGVDLFPGNTTDIQTFTKQTEKVKKDFGCERVTFVTDRGIIKGPQMRDLKDNNNYYITAITKPQMEKLLGENILQMSLFDETIREILSPTGDRLIFRRNPGRVEEIRRTRENKYQYLLSLSIEKNDYLAKHKRAKLTTVVKELEEKINRLKLNKWVLIKKDETGRRVGIEKDGEKLAEEEKLDGCYCMKTNLPQAQAERQVIHDRYKDLGLVEQAFRTEKTGLLELRPWYVLTDESTRAHAFVTMLAYKIIRFLKDVWIGENLTVEEGLKKLATITTYSLTVKGTPCGIRIAKPDTQSARLLSLAGVTLPETIPCLGAHVVSRKKLQKERK